MSPYIKDNDVRDAIECRVFELMRYVDTVGDLNFAITALLHRWVKRQTLSYRSLMICVGTLDMVKAEFYRTVVAPYEDVKRDANGSVSNLDRLR